MLEHGGVEHVRLLPPTRGVCDLATWTAAIDALARRAELLPVVAADYAELDGFAPMVAALARRLAPAHCGIELSVAPPVASPWRGPIDPDALARALADASRLARAAGCDIAWGLGSAAEAAMHLDVLERHELFAPGDAVVIDQSEHSLDGPTLERLDAALRRLGSRRMWLAAGLGESASPSEPASPSKPARPSELAEHVVALGTSVDRLYWTHALDGPLSRLWLRTGPRRTARLLGSTAKRKRPAAPRVLVTGGAGFVGCNLAARLLERGQSVVVLDDLRRGGVEQNLAWLAERGDDRFAFVPGDVRCKSDVRTALEGVEQVFHLAAQVAVTTSMSDPIEDFEINARGTLTVLEEMRRLPSPPGLVFTSTNKVYGDLDDVTLVDEDQRWVPADSLVRARGVDENRSLALHSPYGCSKGAGDQYVLDYAKSYGIPTAVFRMSCIYGPHQFGTEDQGWVAHFLRRALDERPITIYGDGKQVRDILFVEDLVDAFLLASERIRRLSGRAFNIGGGPGNAISLLDLLARIGRIHGRAPHVTYSDWRRGDQRYYVSDTTLFMNATGWQPAVGVDEGLERLYRWLRELAGPVGRNTSENRGDTPHPVVS
jgi:CDP-paratose 2-epimerase